MILFHWTRDTGEGLFVAIYNALPTTRNQTVSNNFEEKADFMVGRRTLDFEENGREDHRLNLNETIDNGRTRMINQITNTEVFFLLFVYSLPSTNTLGDKIITKYSFYTFYDNVLLKTRVW